MLENDSLVGMPKSSMCSLILHYYRLRKCHLGIACYITFITRFSHYFLTVPLVTRPIRRTFHRCERADIP